MEHNDCQSSMRKRISSNARACWREGIICLFLCLAIVARTSANKIQVSNVVLTGQDLTEQFTLVQFDLSWENSWRINIGPSNWDAAWVFVKYRKNGGPWEHATLNYGDGTGTGDGHTVPAGAMINTVAAQTGCFVYRDTVGNGDVSYTGIQLRWEYDDDGVQDEDLVDVKVFAIEMVYIPEGQFYVGADTGSLVYDNFYSEGLLFVEYPYLVTSEAEITVSPATNYFYYHVESPYNESDQQGPIPAAFPKGYNDFYLMKYEVTEEQWVSFFNSLTPGQQAVHDITDADHKGINDVKFRNTITISGNRAYTNAPNRALTYVVPDDIVAYLDWTGLRPMTEFEFEKACRGPLNVVVDEFAWGTSNIFSTTYTIVNDGTENALVSNPGIGSGNCNYFATDPLGPMRVGIFAASAVTKNREETGAGYYGVMELSGNVWEYCISVGSPSNRAFTGLHGNGELNSDGYADVSNWPTDDIASIRGGAWQILAEAELKAGDRTFGTVSFLGGNTLGFRGARTAE